MSALRSGYSTQVYAFDPSTGIMVPQTIQWQKCVAGAVRTLTHHQYDSLNYTKGVAYPDSVGEIIGAARTWQNGAPSAGQVGTNHVGADALWLGRLTALSSPLVESGYGLPAACNVPVLCMRYVVAAPLLTEQGVVRTMVTAGPNTWKLQSTTDTTAAWVYARVTGPLCGGGQPGLLFAANWPGLGAAVQCLLFSGGYPTRDGDWYVPVSSPHNARVAVHVHN
jgi:hypothetical protein